MALRNCGVLATEQRGHRATDDVASAEHNSVQSRQVHSSGLQKTDTSSRRARGKERVRRARGQVTNVIGVESARLREITTQREKDLNIPIDVFFRTDCFGDLTLSLRTDVVPERELDEDTTGLLVVVQLAHEIDNLLGRGLGGDLDVIELDACLRGSLGLHAHIGRRVRTLPRLDDGQRGLETGEVGLDGLDLRGNTIPR